MRRNENLAFLFIAPVNFGWPRLVCCGVQRVRFCRKKLDAGRGSKALKYVPTAFAQLPFYRDAFAVGGFIQDQGCDVYHILVHHSLCRNLCQSICCIVVHSPTCMSNSSMLLKSLRAEMNACIALSKNITHLRNEPESPTQPIPV